MSLLKRRIRSVLVALAVLVLSAGVAMAGRGSHPADAAVVPNTQVTATNGQDAQGDQDEQRDDADAPDTGQVPEADTTDGTETEATATDGASPDAATAHPDNHGLLVSQAAQAPTPTGFGNHGAYVRTVAHDHGGATAPAKGETTSGAAKTKHATHATGHSAAH